MPIATTNGDGTIKWSWVGKGLGVALLGGIPSVIAGVLYVAVHLTRIEANQESTTKVLVDQQAAIDRMEGRLRFFRSDEDKAWTDFKDRLAAEEAETRARHERKVRSQP